MGEPARRLATWEDLLKAPDDGRLAAGANAHTPRSPDERTLEAYEADSGAWVRLGACSDGDTPRIEPFDAIELDVGALFAPRA